MSVVRGQETRGRATGSCDTPRGTPPYSRKRQQRPETRPEGPLPEAGKTLFISELYRRVPAQIVSKSGATTCLVDGCVIQESLPPCSSTTAATTTSVGGPHYCYRVSSADAPPSTIPGPGTSGAVTQAVTAKRDPPQFLDTSFVVTPALSLPGAAKSTMKLMPKQKTPSLACTKTEEGLQTIPSKTTSSVPGAAATITKSKLVKGKAPQVPPTSIRDSVASQASPALLITPRQRQQEPTHPLQNRDNSPEKWTVDDVARYVSIRGCEHMAEKFRHQEIDGVALFLIKEHHLMTAMNVKLGPALKMCAAIGSLREVS